MVDLLELAERCEKAEGPDRWLDVEIAAALPRGDWWQDCMGEPGYEPRHFTASIDAALTLVPEGWFVASLSQDATGWWAGLRPAIASVTTEWTGGWEPSPNAALALCAASLRARSYVDDPEGVAEKVAAILEKHWTDHD
jgi:hypothetical protein